MKASVKTQGFTLIEIAIVLTVIALLIGGILAGQSLMRSSEIQSVGIDAQRYLTAIRSFKAQYIYLPGDMPNATTYWGAAHATPATCYTTTSTDTKTCNGNGNRLVDYSYVCSAADCSTVFTMAANEDFSLWKQLVNAGYITGNFTNTRSTPISLGSSVPASKIPNVGFAFSTIPIQGGIGWPTVQYIQPYGNILIIASPVVAANATPVLAAFTPKEAASLDRKMDDGMPGTGRWIASLMSTPTTNRFNNPTTACTTATSNTDYLKPYNVSLNSKLCSFMVISGF